MFSVALKTSSSGFLAIEGLGRLKAGRDGDEVTALEGYETLADRSTISLCEG